MAINYSDRLFEEQFTYNGTDLGARWSPEKTVFRVWAPTAQSVTLRLYASGEPEQEDLLEQIPMTKDVQGTWVAEKCGDQQGVYYTYFVCVDGIWQEACDPYARTTGVNGCRAMVLDLNATNPAGWEHDTDPNGGKPFTDAVIWELHVRDLSMHPSSGIHNKGTYLGLTETGTTTPDGIPTGLDHMKALGITHLHILPFYDYGSVDEAHPEVPQFNWGYDPVNFNVPEGSYSSDPHHGEVRIREVKQMIHTLHQNGISVVMDVVYNHVYDAKSFCFNRIVPDYFSRTNADGTYSDGSCCGNDTASERSMVRKYIVDSVKYWADEYHIDGFRFDLVGLIDTETIREVMDCVHADHPGVVFYGEGWDMPTVLTKPNVTMTIQKNAGEVPGFAFFSDTVRDLLRGSVFFDTRPGFLAGASASKEELEHCYQGMPEWCPTPLQSVNYVSCHDNHTLFDRLALTMPDGKDAEWARRNRLAAAFIFTAQGIPFLQAGEEMLRSKRLPDGTRDHNSYRSPDSVNAIAWDNLNLPEYRNTLAYYQGLIAFRKAHPVLRLTDPAAVKQAVVAVSTGNSHCVAFEIQGLGEHLFCVFNADNRVVTLPLPNGNWTLCVDDTRAGVDGTAYPHSTISVPAGSAMILTDGE